MQKLVVDVPHQDLGGPSIEPDGAVALGLAACRDLLAQPQLVPLHHIRGTLERGLAEGLGRGLLHVEVLVCLEHPRNWTSQPPFLGHRLWWGSGQKSLPLG